LQYGTEGKCDVWSAVRAAPPLGDPVPAAHLTVYCAAQGVMLYELVTGKSPWGKDRSVHTASRVHWDSSGECWAHPQYAQVHDLLQKILVVRSVLLHSRRKPIRLHLETRVCLVTW
jgi:hypothetical protein